MLESNKTEPSAHFSQLKGKSGAKKDFRHSPKWTPDIFEQIQTTEKA